MELIKNHLRQLSVKSEAVSQVTFDEDWNVPDVKPDVGRMIQKKGRWRWPRFRWGRPGQGSGKSLLFSALRIGRGGKESLQSGGKTSH